MEKYESSQQRINRPVLQIYAVLSDFRNFTPIIRDKVDDWQADENTCSFKVKGITMNLRIVDKVPGEFIKFSDDGSSPMEFNFWIQMKEVAPSDTRIRLVLHAKLNMMMKMMVGGKLQDAIDQMARQVAMAFNGIMPEGTDMFTMPIDAIDTEDAIIDYTTFINPDKPVS